MLYPDNRYKYSKNVYNKINKKKYFIIFVILIILISIFFINKNNYLFSVFNKNKSEINSLNILWENKKYSELISSSNNILDNNPIEYNVLVLAGFAYFYEGISKFSLEEKLPFFNKSIVLLRKALLFKNKTMESKIKYILGKVYYHKGKFYVNLAIKYLEEALGLGYVSGDLYEYLGLSYTELNDFEKSLEYFNMAALENETDLILLTLAQAYMKNNNTKLAEEYLIRTINKTKDLLIDEKSRMILGNIYIGKKEYLKAEDQFQKIITNNENSADAYYYTGKIYDQMNNKIKARAFMRKVLKIEPNHKGAIHYLY